MKIGIIGAGLAGLCTAKILKAFGFDVMVFEKESDLGGVWSSSRRYPGLTTQNPRDTYAFSDFPMPKDYPEWPTGEQVQRYLERYVSHFGLNEHIQFDAEVLQAIPLPDYKGWTVSVRRTQTRNVTASTYTLDWLIVCNGIFSLPNVPLFKGTDSFTQGGGLILHTSRFTTLEHARRRHVVVVGYGKSSCDAANAITGVSASTTVIARHLIWKIPKRLMNVLNFKHLFLTRLGEGLFKYIQVSGFEKFLHGAGLPIRNAMLGTVEGIVAKQLRLREVGLLPETPLESIARSTVSLVTDGFYEKVFSGALKIRPGVEIARLEPGRAVLSDGESIPADLIVCGTGWHQQASFLDPKTMDKVTDADGNFLLYRSMLPTGVPRLAFNGYNSSFFSQLNAEVSALWLVEYLRGRMTVPPESERVAQIKERLAWMEARTDGKHSKGTNIIPFSVHHMDELLHDIGLALPLRTRLKQWLMAINAADYAPLHRRLMRRHEASSRSPLPNSVQRGRL